MLPNHSFPHLPDPADREYYYKPGENAQRLRLELPRSSALPWGPANREKYEIYETLALEVACRG
jgi:hypothetical protein